MSLVVSQSVIVCSDLSSVDAAASEQDPIKRIAYVAAFAMSNYSSTIGRIAKPFNPMLVRHFHAPIKSGCMRTHLTCLIREKPLNMSG
jgi:hypothetical protein